MTDCCDAGTGTEDHPDNSFYFRDTPAASVDSVHALLERIGGTVVHGPQEDGWVPGYYSVLFEDPDGIRLEVNHIPGKGVFDPKVERKEIVGPP